MTKIPLKLLLSILIVFLSHSSMSVANNIPHSLNPYPLTCIENTELQQARSNELQDIVNADQADRQNWKDISEKEMVEMTKRDLIRRKRVGEIFGEGCFKDAKDYMAAALVFQHGDTSDQFYQAFIWSKRAAELGDLNAQYFSALAIDRYLIKTGRRQLFASQYQKFPSDICYCLQPVEKTFPDDFRKEYSGRSLKDSYQTLEMLNGAGCPSLECKTPLQPTPKGSFIGVW